MKETFYFSHDYNTRSDLKIKRLIRERGFEAYGIFWAIVEDLYNNDNRLDLDFGLIAYDLRVDENLIKAILMDYDLFIIDIDYFYSQSIENRLDHRSEKSNKARESVNKRWEKKRKAEQKAAGSKEVNTTVSEPYNEKDTNAIRPNNDSNTIKDIKERKGKDIKERIVNNNTAPPIVSFPIRPGKKRADNLFEVDIGFVENLKTEISELTDDIIKSEFVKIKYWLEEKANRLKTESGMPRFLHTWMTNAIIYRKNNKNGKNGNDPITNEKYAANREQFANELDGYYPD